MLVFKALKRIIGKMDLFSSIQLLRFDGDAETKTFTGGVFSLAIIIYLLSTFSTMVFETFSKLIITSATDTTQDNEPEPIYLLTTDNASHFMIGVEVWHFDLNTGPRYFDVELQNSFMVDGIPGNDSVKYTMQPCTKQHWGSIPNGSQIYDKVGMQTWLCMPLNITPVLKGKYYSDLQTTLDINLKKCDNKTDPNRLCAPQQQIDAYLQLNAPIYFTPFFINPLINPQNKDYLKLYLQDRYYTVFGVDYGMNMYVYNAAYQITTDQSILPFTSNHYQNGSTVTSVLTNSFSLGKQNNIYGFISFFREPSTMIITRSYQKVIDAFSYVGGLLGSFLLVLIFVNFYNECSYEMRFASMYKSDKDCPTTAKKFNIGYYFLQSVYNLLRMVKIKCEQWKSVKFFHQTREEMVRQLDVKYLFKKLHILQNGMMLLLTKAQLKGLMLQHQMTVSEAKKTRRIYGLKKKIKKILKQKLKKNQEEQIENRQAPNFNTTTQFFPQTNINRQNSVANQFFPKMLKEVESPQKEKTPPLKKFKVDYLSSSQSGESSESSEQQNSQINQRKIIEDISQLKQQASNNKMSAIILQNLDPFIKNFYQAFSSTQFNQQSIVYSPQKESLPQRLMRTQKIKVAADQGQIKIDPPINQLKNQNGFTYIQ